GSKRSRTASRPPASIVSSSAVTTKRPPATASSILDMPPRRRLLVPLRCGVLPRRRVPQPVVDGRPDVVDLLAPGQLPRALDRLQPHATHLRLHLAGAVGPHAPARPVAQHLRTVHRARETRGVEDALTAHLTAEDGLLDGGLDERERFHHAGTADRLRSIRSF